MSVSSIPPASTGSAPPTAPIANDRDGDRDNDATEGAAEKARETQAAASSLPVDPNRGRALNISA